jgi:hypothetical protein
MDQRSAEPRREAEELEIARAEMEQESSAVPSVAVNNGPGPPPERVGSFPEPLRLPPQDDVSAENTPRWGRTAREPVQSRSARPRWARWLPFLLLS